MFSYLLRKAAGGGPLAERSEERVVEGASHGAEHATYTDHHPSPRHAQGHDRTRSHALEPPARPHPGQADLSPQQARKLTIYGAHQNEDGTYSWKFDNHARWGGGVGGLSNRDQQKLWECITAPVMLVRGMESWASDPVADGRIKHFKDARLVNVEGAGHWVHHDQLNVFMRETEGFLAE